MIPDIDQGGRWINLSPFESDEFGVPRAYVQMTTTPSEDSLANAMDAAILALANQLAGNNPANLQITSQGRDGLGTTCHEAGTLWNKCPDLSDRHQWEVSQRRKCILCR
jgi:hypothetical protein